MHNNQNNHTKCRYKVEQRRMKISSLLAQSRTEVEIARELGVTQATVSRDVKVLKELSQQFVFDLAKSDLAYYYKQCIDGIEEVRRKAWDMFKAKKNGQSDDDGGNNIGYELIPRDKLLALKVIRECNEAKYSLFQQGPSIMNVKSLEERLIKIEGNSNRQNFE